MLIKYRKKQQLAREKERTEITNNIRVLTNYNEESKMKLETEERRRRKNKNVRI